MVLTFIEEYIAKTGLDTDPETLQSWISFFKDCASSYYKMKHFMFEALRYVIVYGHAAYRCGRACTTLLTSIRAAAGLIDKKIEKDFEVFVILFNV